MLSRRSQCLPCGESHTVDIWTPAVSNYLGVINLIWEDLPSLQECGICKLLCKQAFSHSSPQHSVNSYFFSGGESMSLHPTRPKAALMLHYRSYFQMLPPLNLLQLQIFIHSYGQMTFCPLPPHAWSWTLPLSSRCLLSHLVPPIFLPIMSFLFCILSEI